MMEYKFPFNLNQVRFSQSNIHGNEVFATKNIKKNEIITFYPADFVAGQPWIYSLIPSDEMSGLNINLSQGNSILDLYCLEINQNYKIVGHPDLKKIWIMLATCVMMEQ